MDGTSEKSALIMIFIPNSCLINVRISHCFSIHLESGVFRDEWRFQMFLNLEKHRCGNQRKTNWTAMEPQIITIGWVSGPQFEFLLSTSSDLRRNLLKIDQHRAKSELRPLESRCFRLISSRAVIRATVEPAIDFCWRVKANHLLCGLLSLYVLSFRLW